MAITNGGDLMDQAQNDNEQATQSVNDLKNTVNTAKQLKQRADNYRNQKKNPNGDPKGSKGPNAPKAGEGANAAKAADGAGKAAKAGKAASDANKAAQAGKAAATAAKVAKAGKAAASMASGAAGGPAGLAATAAIEFAKVAANDPIKAGMIAAAPLILFLAPIFFLLFIIFSFLSWLNPFSTTNITAGDNEEAQELDAKELQSTEGSETDIEEYLSDPKNNTTAKQYKLMADLLQEGVDKAHEKAVKAYDNEYNKYSSDDSYQTHDDIGRVHLSPDGGYYGGVTGVDSIKLNFLDEKELEGKAFDNTRYFIDNSKNGKIESGTTYIVAAYSVSKGNTAPAKVENGGDKYSYYINFKELVEDEELAKEYFSYNGNLVETPKTMTVQVVEYEQVREKTGTIINSVYNKATEKWEEKKVDVYEDIWHPILQDGKDYTYEKEFTYTEYSYKGTLSPFSKDKLIEKMFLDDNEFYADAAGFMAGSSTIGGGKTSGNFSGVPLDCIDPDSIQATVANIAKNNRGTYPCTAGYCAAWVSGVYDAAGLGRPSGNAIDYWNQWKDSGSTSSENIPVGAVVVGSGSNNPEGGKRYGHVGIHIGNGMIAHNIGHHDICSLAQWVAGSCKGTMFPQYGGYHGYIGWVWPFGKPLDGGLKESGSSLSVTTKYKKYTLSNSELEGIANVLTHIDGSENDIKTYASLIANQFEKDKRGKSSIVEYVKSIGLVSDASNLFNNSTGVSSAATQAVKEVLVEGKRTLPEYVDSAVRLQDVAKATLGNNEIIVSDPNAYAKDDSKVTTTNGATFTFYKFNSSNSVIFGYQKKSGWDSDDNYYTDDGGFQMNSSGLSRSQKLNNIMNSPYYQWGVYYNYECGHPSSYEQECPECGKPFKTISKGFLFWKSKMPDFKYVKAAQPDVNYVSKIGGDGETETNKRPYTVAEKIDYYVQDMVNSIILDPDNKELNLQQYESNLSNLAYGGGGFSGSFGSGGSKKFVEVALSQVGTNGAKSWNYYGFQGHWCAMFVSYCASEAGLIGNDASQDSGTTTAFGSNGIIPKYCNCGLGEDSFKAKNLWQGRGYQPNPGDVIFFDWDHDGYTDHTGIVEKSEGGVVYTIEGNSGGSGEGEAFFRSSSVKQHQYSINSSDIYGYGTPEFPSSANLIGNDIPEQIWNYFKGQGIPEVQIASILGNMYGESGLDPSIIEHGNGIGLGLCQWSYGRRTNLENFAAAQGKPASDLGVQLDFFMTEIPGGFSNMGRYSEWMSTSSIYEATASFMWHWERPARWAGEQSLPKRTAFAEQCYSRFNTSI